MLQAISFVFKIAADIGIGTIVNASAKTILSPYSLNTIQKIGVGAAEFAVTGIAAEKANNYIDSFCEDVAELMVKHNVDKEFNRNWTAGGRTDHANK